MGLILLIEIYIDRLAFSCFRILEVCGMEFRRALIFTFDYFKNVKYFIGVQLVHFEEMDMEEQIISPQGPFVYHICMI